MQAMVTLGPRVQGARAQLEEATVLFQSLVSSEALTATTRCIRAVASGLNDRDVGRFRLSEALKIGGIKTKDPGMPVVKSVLDVVVEVGGVNVPCLPEQSGRDVLQRHNWCQLAFLTHSPSPPPPVCCR
jgi:hypothetical protein